MCSRSYLFWHYGCCEELAAMVFGSCLVVWVGWWEDGILQCWYFLRSLCKSWSYKVILLSTICIMAAASSYILN